MTDTAAIHRRMKEFLRFATRESGASILFGVQFDPAEGKWMAAMSAGPTKCLFPPGAGRAFIRETAETLSASMKDLTDQLKADLGAGEYRAILEQMASACKTALERNAAGAKPQFFAHSGPGNLDS